MLTIVDHWFEEGHGCQITRLACWRQVCWFFKLAARRQFSQQTSGLESIECGVHVFSTVATGSILVEVVISLGWRARGNSSHGPFVVHTMLTAVKESFLIQYYFIRGCFQSPSTLSVLLMTNNYCLHELLVTDVLFSKMDISQNVSLETVLR